MGGYRPPFLTQRTPTQSVGYGVARQRGQVRLAQTEDFYRPTPRPSGATLPLQGGGEELNHSFWNSLSVALIRSLSGCSAQYCPSFLALTTRAAVSITGGSSSSL